MKKRSLMKVSNLLEIPSKVSADELIRLRTGISNLNDYKVSKRPASAKINKLSAVREAVRAAQRNNAPTIEESIKEAQIKHNKLMEVLSNWSSASRASKYLKKRDGIGGGHVASLDVNPNPNNKKPTEMQRKSIKALIMDKGIKGNDKFEGIPESNKMIENPSIISPPSYAKESNAPIFNPPNVIKESNEAAAIENPGPETNKNMVINETPIEEKKFENNTELNPLPSLNNANVDPVLQSKYVEPPSIDQEIPEESLEESKAPEVVMNTQKTCIIPSPQNMEAPIKLESQNHANQEPEIKSTLIPISNKLPVELPQRTNGSNAKADIVNTINEFQNSFKNGFSDLNNKLSTIENKISKSARNINLIRRMRVQDNLSQTNAKTFHPLPEEVNIDKTQKYNDKITQSSFPKSNDLENTIIELLPLMKAWENAEALIMKNDVEGAYKVVLETNDDLFLLRLMIITGPCSSKLSTETSSKIILRINSIARCNLIGTLLLDWSEHMMENGDFSSMDHIVQNEVLDSLYLIGQGNTDQSKKSNYLYEVFFSKNQ